MRRSILFAGLSAAVLVGGVLALALRPGEETPEGPRIFKRTPVPRPIEGDAALVVDPSAGLFATRMGVRPFGRHEIDLLTPRDAAEECAEKCPPDTRIEGGAEGRRRAFEVAEAFADLVRALADTPGLEPQLAAEFRAGLREIEARFSPGSKAVVRVLFVRSPMNTMEGPVNVTGLAIYDAYDKLFDAKRPQEGGGVRLVANRLETIPAAPGEKPRIRSGAIDVSVGSREIDRAALRSSNSGYMRAFRSPIANHFLNDRVPVAGIAYNEVGGLAVYGLSPKPRMIADDPRLLAAVAAVLRGL